MRQPEQAPLDPETVAVLEAIDATLAGEAVDPVHAELAELALMLSDACPAVDPAFASGLDERVRRRFAAAPRARRRRISRLVWAPALGVAASVAVAIVIVVGGGGGSGSSAVATSASSASIPRPPETLSAPAHHHAATASSTAASTAAAPRGANTGFLGARGPQGPQGPQGPIGPVNGSGQYVGPPTTGRKVIQAAQLSLTTTSRHVEQVAQEVYNVVALQKGIVKSSRVTATGGQGGYAQFQLSVPSANLSPTMTALSNLAYARVVSRTDSNQDVTNQYNADRQRLADAQAQRTSLLKQLANALTQAQIDSLTARIHDAEQAIASDQATLHSLQRQVGYSQILVTVNANGLPAPIHRGTGGFTLGKATHDAGRVLTVAAGVALIGLAALVPLGLVLALLGWIYTALRRRRRLQALELS